MDNRLLREIGLTEGEARVYLALLRLGASKTGPLVKAAGVSSSKVYKILDRLENKGLAGHMLKGNVRHFAATKPRRILDYLDEEEGRLGHRRAVAERMLPELERQQGSATGKAEATAYDGFKAVTNFFRSMLDELSPGDSYGVIGAGYGKVPGLREFFLAHHRRRAKKGIRLRMLANHDVKGTLVPTTSLNSEIRYLPQYLMTNAQILFYRDKVFIAVWTREPKGFLLESEEAVKNFRGYFNVLWKIAKP